MSDPISSGPSASGFIFGFIALFVILYSMWYYSGGPQKETSNKAFITGPNTDNYYKQPTVYGTVNSIDKVNRDLNR